MQQHGLGAGGFFAPLTIPWPPSIYHPNRWYMDGEDMTADIHQLRPKPGDSEKITINLGYIDLGQIDLMVQEGFYSNRTDFIRTASAISSNDTPKWSRSLRSGRAWISACGTTVAKISKWRVAPVKCCKSMCSASPASPWMSLPSLLAPPSRQSSCWGPSRLVLKSRMHWPTGCGDDVANRGRSSLWRGHAIASDQRKDWI
jgi:hypothetical protein